MKTTASTTIPTTIQSALLEKLRQAGTVGLKKSELARKKAEQEALAALLRGGQARNIGAARKPRYVLAEFFTPLPIAAGLIEKLAQAKPQALFSRKQLAAACPPGAIAQAADAAIAELAAQGRLLKFRYRNFFLYALASSPAPAVAAPACSREQVLAAYRRVKQRRGFSHVEIAELQQECGVALAELQEFLRQQARAGQAVLSLGEWSLASPQARAAAIEIRGQPYLLVGFDG